ncbi:MAG: hypothetical protein JW860_10870 [Sedimentisphaerales bacterium]|nr:hypothetical protein [Sedimentisphaerales bacterium]
MKTAEINGLIILAVLFSATSLWGQQSGGPGYEMDWQGSIISGWFSNGSWMDTKIEGEPVRLSTDNGLMMGLRLSGDKEFYGVDFTLAGVFMDMELDANPAANVPSVKDASLLLAEVNGLVFPAGNTMVEGRVRPYITAGTGLALFNSDFSEADNEIMPKFNVGAGVKFLLGDEGNPVLRFDWRWHYFIGSVANLKSDIFRQEISLGIGIRF